MKRPEGIWRRQLPLKFALDTALRSSLDKKDRELVTLATEWPLIAGAEIARFCHPKSIRKSKQEAVLYIAVESGYATFLQHELPQLQTRIAQFLGEGRIQRIRLEQC